MRCNMSYTYYLRDKKITNKTIEECRQYEPDYRNEIRFYLDSINKLDFGFS